MVPPKSQSFPRPLEVLLTHRGSGKIPPWDLVELRSSGSCCARLRSLAASKPRPRLMLPWWLATLMKLTLKTRRLNHDT